MVDKVTKYTGEHALMCSNIAIGNLEFENRALKEEIVKLQQQIQYFKMCGGLV